MESNRLIINEYDLSSTNIQEETRISGFTVVKAPKGPITPIKIPSGGTSKIRDIFGQSSKDYPELYEVERFNEEYDLFVSAPYSSAQVPVAYITGEGIFPGASTVKYDSSIEDYILNDSGDNASVESNLIPSGASILKDIRYPKSMNLGASSDISSSYPSYFYNEEKTYLKVEIGLTKAQLIDLCSSSGSTILIKKLPSITEGITSVEINIDNTGSISQNSTVSTRRTKHIIGSVSDENEKEFEEVADNDLVYLYITGYEVSTGSSENTGDIITTSYIQKNLYSEDSRQSLELYWKESVTADDIYGVIFPKYPSNRVLHLSFQSFNSNRGYSSSSVDSRNIIKVEAYEDGAFHNINHPVSFTGSLQTSATDASGIKIGLTDSNTAYSEQDLVYVYVVKPFTDPSEIKTKDLLKYPDVKLEGGNKTIGEGEESDDLDIHNIGWEKAQDEEYSTVDIFINPYRNSAKDLDSSSNLYFNLANYHMQARYIYSYTVGPEEIPDTPITYGTSTDLVGARYWGFCNEAIIALGSGDKITSPMTGVVAQMIAVILEGRYGGIAPMYTNTAGMGGQLNISPVRLRYKYNKNQQDKLLEANLNPIIYDHTYGVMIVGHVTCKAGDRTNWSYIGHVSSFILIEKEIRENVMIPQLGKANNPYYRTLRKQQVDNLLSLRTSGDNRIWSQAFCDTSTRDGVNDASAQRNKQFKILVGVRPDSFSEYVILNFQTYDQGTNLYSISEYTMGDEE